MIALAVVLGVALLALGLFLVDVKLTADESAARDEEWNRNRERQQHDGRFR